MKHWKNGIMEYWNNEHSKFHYSNLPIFLFLYAVFFVHIRNAAEEGYRFLIALVSHAVNFHGGDKDEIIGSQNFFANDLVGFGIVLEAPHMTGENIHGLIIEMIVNRDFSAGADGEKSEAVFDRVFRAGLGEPADPDVFYREGLSLVRIGFDLLIFFVIHIHYDHGFISFYG
jgi:hypothetical protein